MEIIDSSRLAFGLFLGVIVGVLSNIIAGYLEKLLETHFGKWRTLIAFSLFLAITFFYVTWETSRPEIHVLTPEINLETPETKLETVEAQYWEILNALGTIQSGGQGESGEPNATATFAVQQLPVLQETISALETTLAVSRTPPSIVATPSPSQAITLPSNPGLGSELIRETDSMKMTFIPGGTFLMGSPENDPEAETFEQPQHNVAVDGFWLDNYEVTNSRFIEFLNSVVPDESQLNEWLEISSENSQIRFVGEKYDLLSFDSASDPVVEVSWYGANEYCHWAGGRLPTEEEWEYAARGSDGRNYPWGNSFNGSVLNFCDQNCPRDWRNNAYNDGFSKTSPVGSFPSGLSWSGIFDLAGNVAEWTANGLYSYNVEADWASQGFLATQSDPNKGFHKVVRGGSWANTDKFVRTAHRTYPAPEETSEFIGFRCAVSQ